MPARGTGEAGRCGGSHEYRAPDQVRDECHCHAEEGGPIDAFADSPFRQFGKAERKEDGNAKEVRGEGGGQAQYECDAPSHDVAEFGILEPVPAQQGQRRKAQQRGVGAGQRSPGTQGGGKRHEESRGAVDGAGIPPDDEREAEAHQTEGATEGKRASRRRSPKIAEEVVHGGVGDWADRPGRRP
jgi:hypothetical protein